ncbi:hypothetical protein ACFU3E_03450 [Streptomyces sp. NPDC057424]|uniref:hypothetical protein n=1 Tax=Streptomyces sp. NPDC057424 TaxID=3346127 RepID=UPI0036CC8DA0
MIPEPVLRPAASRGPGLELCHRSRLFLNDGDLVLQTRRRTFHFPVGDGGIARAVFIDAAGADKERMGPAIRGSWGELQLQDHGGALVGWFDMEDWLPESPALPKRSVQGEQLLSRTGVAALLKAAGIPLHVVRDRNDPLVSKKTRRGGGRSLGPGSAIPLWYWGTRAAAGLVWFALFTVIVLFDAAAPWVILPLSAAAFVAPVTRLALRGWTRLRLRRYSPSVRERIGPAPVSGLGATVRFCRDTELRVQDHDLVLRDISGQEFWLPLTGPHAVTSLVLVRDKGGTALGAELRGADEQLRAVLPWRLWFAGKNGEDGWSRLCSATGMRHTERRLSGRVGWPKGPTLGAQLLPESRRDARSLSRFPRTIAGVSSTAVMAFGSFFSVTQGLRVEDTHPTAGMAALLMGALGGFLQAAPYLIHQLRSRLRLDRPAAEQTSVESVA